MAKTTLAKHKKLYMPKLVDLYVSIGEGIDTAFHKYKHRRTKTSEYKYRNHLRNLAEISEHWFPTSAFWVGDDDRKYCKRLYRCNHAPGASGYLKNDCNRQVRRHTDVPQRCGYKKVADFWWRLY